MGHCEEPADGAAAASVAPRRHEPPIFFFVNIAAPKDRHLASAELAQRTSLSRRRAAGSLAPVGAAVRAAPANLQQLLLACAWLML